MRNVIFPVVFLAAELFSATVRGATVTSLADSGPGSLRQTIADAVPGSTIDFSVTGTIILTSGELLINKTLTITGPGAQSLTVQRSLASGTLDFRIFHISSGIVTLSGLTMNNGRAAVGGGIDNESTFTLLDSVIIGNTATLDGGGINNLSTLTMSNCLINANSVVAASGGAGGGLNNEGTVTAISSTISSNSITGGDGGGVNNDGTFNVTNSVINGNVSVQSGTATAHGGGIFNEGTLTLSTTTVSGNAVSGGAGSSGGGAEGGGIANDLGTSTVVMSTVSGNSANTGAGATNGPAHGGGIENGVGTVTVENSTISGNAVNGGAGAPPEGGGFWNGLGSLEINHATITSNTVSGPSAVSTLAGGGLFNAGGVIAFKNTILAGNTAVELVNAQSGEIDSGGFNLIGSTNGPVPPGPSDQFNVAVESLKLGPLQNNGGPTFTHALLCGSIAINAGDNTGAPPTDQRGFPRIVGGTIDIGAYESDNTFPTIVCPVPSVVNCAGPTGAVATLEVVVGNAEPGGLRVVWAVDGVFYQTNDLQASGPIISQPVDFTAVFGVGTHSVIVSASTTNDCVTNCSTRITINQDTNRPAITCSADKTNECDNVAPLNFDPPMASDECGSVTITILNTLTNLGCGKTFVATRTWVAIDQAGNTNICSQTIAVVDTKPPGISCPTNLTVSCAGQVPAQDTNSVISSDSCGGAVTVTWQGDTISSSNCPGQFVISRTYRASDQCGNSATCVQSITVNDTNAPSITCPSNLTVSCAGQVPAPDNNSVISSDNCGGAVSVSWQGDAISSSNCPGQFVISRTYRASDQCGNSATCIQTIRVNDTNAPSITCPSNLTVSCAGQVPAPDNNSVISSDNCGGAVSVSWQGDAISSSNCPGQFVISRTYRASDQCGNSATCTQTIRVNDTNAPSITCAANLTVSCAGQVPAPDTNSVTSSDNCGGPVSVSWQGDAISSSNCPGQFVISRTYRASDQCGNSATCIQTIRVNDTNAPSITCAANLTVSCAGQVPAPDTNSVISSDNCGGPVMVSWQGDAVSSSNCPGQFVISRTYRVADQCGNSATCTQTIRVNDTNAPSITCAANLTVSCAGQVPAPDTNSVTSSDNCGGPVSVTWQGDVVSSSNCPGQFVISRTYRASDQCGNSATCVQTIRVNDTNAPSITCPGNLTVSCAGQVPAPDTNSVISSDNCGGPVSVTWQGDVVSSSNCPGQFVISRTYRASDQCGNSATCVQTIRVNDTNAPSITCPGNLTVSCAGQVPAPDTNSVISSDNCGGPVTVSWQGDAISSSNCPGQFVISRTYRASDQCGNSATCTQTITVNDTNAPSITCPGNLTVNCAGQVPAPDTNSVTSSDNCGGPVTVSWQGDVVSSSNCPGQFVISRTYRASDQCGNSATCTQTITVNDTNAPSITCPGNVTVSCLSQVPAPNTNGVIASDNCGGPVTVLWQGDTINSTNCPGQFVINRTYRASDQCGNGTTCTQTITVNDTNLPSITCPGNLTVSCAGEVPTPNTNSVISSDSCGGAVGVTWQGDTITSSNCPGQFVISRTYRASGPCSNSATCTQTITVNDTNAPSITCPGSVTVSCATQVPAPDTNSVISSDNCGGAVTVTWQGDVISSSNCPGQFVISRTYRASDPCGNSATCTQTIRVNDTNAPSIACPGNLTVSCAGQVPAPDTNSVTSSDNCGGPVTVSWQGDAISSSNCPGQFVISRTYRAADQCGNSATCTQTIRVNDTNAPSVTCPGNVTVSCAGQVPAPDTNSVTSSDNCGGAVSVTWQGDTIGSSNCPGQFVVSRTYRASDQCGNSATCTQTITVNDTNAPSITCPTNLTVSCAGQVPAPNTNSVTSSDNCGGAVTVLWQGDAISSSNCPGRFVINRTYRAFDQCGNGITCTQTITVNDTNPPSITCFGNKTNECGIAGLNFDIPTAVDNCGTATISILSTVTNRGCGNTFVATRTWVATDLCGNTNTCSQIIATVDTTPPNIICSANKTNESSIPNLTFDEPSAADACGAVTVSILSTVTNLTCGDRFVATRTWVAIDQCANTSTCSQTIATVNLAGPTISCPAPVTVSCAPSTGTPVTLSVNVADVSSAALEVVWLVDGIVLQTNTIPAGPAPMSTTVTLSNIFFAGTHKIDVSVTDPNLCSATCSTTVTVQSGGAPRIVCPPPITLNCVPQEGSLATLSVNVFDPAGERMVVVWTLNGVVIQTNIVAASNPPALSRVDLVTFFPAGTNTIIVMVSNSSQCTAACSTTVNVVALGDLYPIALNVQTLANVQVGGVLRDIFNGSKFGNFGWITWAGSPSEPTLVTSLTPPGNSSTYINPNNPADHVVSIGDWVQGKPGVSNSEQVRDALNVLETIDITVPVWDRATGTGNNSLYHVVAFARVRLLSYQLPTPNIITARFLGLVDCNGATTLKMRAPLKARLQRQTVR